LTGLVLVMASNKTTKPVAPAQLPVQGGQTVPLLPFQRWRAVAVCDQQSCWRVAAPQVSHRRVVFWSKSMILVRDDKCIKQMSVRTNSSSTTN
jgi:hypothetical protein